MGGAGAFRSGFGASGWGGARCGLHTSSSDDESADAVASTASVPDAIVPESAGLAESAEAIAALDRELLSASHAADYVPYVPAAFKEMFFFFHTGLDLPWWAAISLGTLFFRASTLPVGLWQRGQAQKMQRATPEINKIKAKLNAMAARGETTGPNVEKVQQQFLQCFRKHGVNPGLSIPISIGLFLGHIGCFWGVHGINALPSVKTGGALWFADMSVADPTFGLPAVAVLSTVFAVRLFRNELEQVLKKAGLTYQHAMLMPLLVAASLGWQPASLQLFLVLQTVSSLGQGYVSNLVYPNDKPALPSPGGLEATVGNKNDGVDGGPGKGGGGGERGGGDGGFGARDAPQDPKARRGGGKRRRRR